MDAHEHLLTVGLPLISNEPGEVREFLPDLARSVAEAGARVVVEEGYGARMGYLAGDYQEASRDLRVVDRDEAFGAGIVLMLRPSHDSLDRLRARTTFLSMLHFPTHKVRAKELKERGIQAIALDLIADDGGHRLVENMQAVAWNGLDVAFGVLQKTQPDFRDVRRPPTRVTILGAGLVGKHAVEAATKYGSLERAADLGCDCFPGVEVTVLGRNMTGDEAYLRRRFRNTDILVDATSRSDPSIPLIRNEVLGELPGHAVITDLAVDPYLLDDDPPVVRGIEGIPRGDLDDFVFAPDDAAWDRLPAAIPTDHRRWVVSCYSWPGIRAVECMQRYGEQLVPLMRALIRRGGAGFLRETGGYFERALYRGSLDAWIDRL